MKIYITNHADVKNIKDAELKIYIHYYEDCQRLNSSYEKNGELIPNSGTTIREFPTDKEFYIWLIKNGYGICRYCEQKLENTEGDTNIFNLNAGEDVSYIEDVIKERHEELKKKGKIL